MNKTVAIIGTHPNTRDKAPYQDETKDIWLFNNQIAQGWASRCSAVFDIHTSDDIQRRGFEHPAYGEWLKNNTDITLYTPHPYPSPANVVYPLQDIINSLLPKFLRGDKVNQYFTSGPTYALALAIYKGYERIEFYGIEMEANTEYIYQRDGIGLWFGIALGKGIEIYMPEESMLFNAPLYGYETTSTKVDREAFETRANELQQTMELTLGAVNATKGALNSVIARIEQAKKAGQPAHKIQLMGEEYEDAQHAYEQAIANHAFVNGQYLDCRSWQVRVEKALEYEGQAQDVLAQNNEKWERLLIKNAELL